MQRKALWLALAFTPLCALASPAGAVTPHDTTHSDNSTDSTGAIQCQMTFSLSGWSVLYKTADGNGTVRCNNGQSMDVKLNVTGGGLTVGKYKLTDGHGKFIGVSNIHQVLGTYASATAHAGIIGSSRMAVMTKGRVTLEAHGAGHGWDFGADISGFTISKAG